MLRCRSGGQHRPTRVDAGTPGVVGAGDPHARRLVAVERPVRNLFPENRASKGGEVLLAKPDLQLITSLFDTTKSAINCAIDHLALARWATGKPGLISITDGTLASTHDQTISAVSSTTVGTQRTRGAS